MSYTRWYTCNLVTVTWIQHPTVYYPIQQSLVNSPISTNPTRYLPRPDANVQALVSLTTHRPTVGYNGEQPWTPNSHHHYNNLFVVGDH